MHGSRSMDNQRTRMTLPTRTTAKDTSKVPQDKTAELSDLSPCNFDSGTASDMDIRFDSRTNLGGEDEEDDPENDGKQTDISSQTWADSGVNLDSGLGIESLTSDLDIQSQLPERDRKCVLPQASQEHKVEPDLSIYQDNDGDSPLHLAVVHGDPHLVFRILALYPEYLNVANHLSQTALHLAVLLDSVRIVRRLVVCGAHLHVCDHRGETPLHLACRLGYLESLKALTIPVISKELKEAGLNNDSTPQAVSRLIPRVLQQRNYDGLTCTHLAISRSHKVLEYILQCGADINSKEGKSGKTVLHLCVERGHPDLLRFLITACQADVNVRNYSQLTPLHLAHLQKRYRGSGSSRTRMDAMIRLLREHGGEPHDLLDSDEETDNSDYDEE